MNSTISQAVNGLSSGIDRNVMGAALRALGNAASSQAVKTAGLVIKAGGGVLAKIGAADFYAIVCGRLVKIAAGTDMPALTGLNITAAYFNVACFFVDKAGTVSVGFGREAAALGGVVFPDFPIDKALVGYLLITHSSAFTGNTTPLDTATTVYFSPTGATDPTILVG